MKRNTNVIGFSLPPETNKKLEGFVKREHKTRSEFFRGLIDMYSKALDEEKNLKTKRGKKFEIPESDLSQALAFYWNLKSKMDSKVIPIGLAVIENKGKVLIGARKDKDAWVKNLSWAFPGGRFKSFELESDLTESIKIETGLKIKVNSLISSRIHPDSGFNKVQIVALYFHCSLVGPNKPKAGGDFKKVAWIKPTDVFKYFTTSTNDDVTKFLVSIEKKV